MIIDDDKSEKLITLAFNAGQEIVEFTIKKLLKSLNQIIALWLMPTWKQTL